LRPDCGGGGGTTASSKSSGPGNKQQPEPFLQGRHWFFACQWATKFFLNVNQQQYLHIHLALDYVVLSLPHLTNHDNSLFCPRPFPTNRIAFVLSLHFCPRRPPSLPPSPPSFSFSSFFFFLAPIFHLLFHPPPFPFLLFLSSFLSPFSPFRI